MGEVWQLSAEYHPYYGDLIKVETGRRISIRRTFVSANGNSYMSAVD